MLVLWLLITYLQTINGMILKKMLLKISPWDTSLEHKQPYLKLVLTANMKVLFSKDQREFIDNTNTIVKYDSRPSLLIFGVGYNF